MDDAVSGSKRKRVDDARMRSRNFAGLEHLAKRFYDDRMWEAKGASKYDRCYTEVGEPPELQEYPRLATMDPADSHTPSYNLSWRAGTGNPWIYQPGCVLPDMSETLEKEKRCSLEIRVESRYLVASNPHLKTRHLWGTDTYSDDSDLVAVLQHAGYHHSTSNAPSFAALLVYIRGVRAPARFRSTSRNLMTSRSWRAPYKRCAFQIIKCLSVNAVGEVTPVLPRKIIPQLTTAHPGKPDIHATGRHFIPDLTVSFNLSNDPCFTFALALVADRGADPEGYTSCKLLREVLYVETARERYEIACINPPPLPREEGEETTEERIDSNKSSSSAGDEKSGESDDTKEKAAADGSTGGSGGERHERVEIETGTDKNDNDKENKEEKVELKGEGERKEKERVATGEERSGGGAKGDGKPVGEAADTATKSSSTVEDGEKKGKDVSSKAASISAPAVTEVAPLRFRFSRVRFPVQLDSDAMNYEKVPLPENLVHVLKTNLDWDDFVWTWDGLTVKGKHFRLQRLMYWQRQPEPPLKRA